MSTESQAVAASPAQPTGELTELGKCFLKHEVSTTHTHTGASTHGSVMGLFLSPSAGHLYDLVDHLVHLSVLEGHQ